MRRVLLPLLCAVLLSSCSIRLGSFTLTSTKNLGYTFTPLQKDVTGEDCAQSILFIPWGTLNPNLQEAVDHAVDQVPGGDMMTNVTIHDDVLITLLYNRNCIRVHGDVVSTAPAKPMTAPSAATPKH
ncbi:MAG: hypothetical protein ACREQI_15755 [Candidatus Binataceae bacterium]